MVAGPKLVAGGTPVTSSAADLQRGQIPTNVTTQQPGALAFRLVDTFQKFDPSTLVDEIATLQTKVTTLEVNVGTLQSQVATLLGFMNSFNWSGAEQATGYTNNGRMVYTRSFYFASGFSHPNAVTQIPHGIPGFSYLVSHHTVDWAGAGGYSFAITYINASSSNNAQDSVSFYIDPTNINSTSGASDRSNDIVMMTLWYTCTDR